MPKWSKFQPRFRVSNSKWKTGCERRTEEQICSSCMRVYTLLMMGVVLQRTPTVCFKAISWDPSRYCGVTPIQHKPLQEGSESLQQIRQQNKEREFFLALEKSTCSTNRHTWCWWHNCGAHNRRHNQIAQSSHFLNSRQSSSAVAQTQINTELTPSTDTCEPGIKTRTRSIKRYKTILPCTLYDFTKFFVKCTEWTVISPRMRAFVFPFFFAVYATSANIDQHASRAIYSCFAKNSVRFVW